MLVKVDEDLPQAAVQVLRVHGYDAVSVVEQGMGGAKDPDLWQVVQAEARFLVTADKGFGDIRSYLPGTHHGVLLLRPDQDGIGSRRPNSSNGRCRLPFGALDRNGHCGPHHEAFGLGKAGPRARNP